MEPDQLTQTKTIYTASAGEVFFKNFLAGLGRALGGIFIYAIFLAISLYSFMTYAYPQIKPLIDEYRQAVQSINKVNNLTPPQQMLQDLQQQLSK